MKNFIRFLAVLFAAISLSTLVGQFFEWPAKISLSKDEYKLAQQVYYDVSWIYFSEIAAFVLTLILLIIERKKKRTFVLLLISLILFVIGIAIFFIFTLPPDIATSDWSIFPDNWESLRDEWEYSNVWRALVNLIGFSFLVLAILKNRNYYKFET